MTRVVLSSIPGAGKELEDYVAGLFQSAGYFVERGIHERTSIDVLELDVVATSYDAPTPRMVLIEAKGGRWGFPDLFKIVGWMHYLGISQGGFFVARDSSPKDWSLFHRKGASLGLSLVDLADFSDPENRFKEAGFGEIRDPLFTHLWRYAFWVERALFDRLRSERRASPQAKGPASVIAYHDVIHDHVFFIKDVRERLALLYQAYREHPKLSLALATESGGGPFEPVVSGRAESPVLTEALREGKHPTLQASLYVEHRGRLAILKAAIELFCVQRAAGCASRDTEYVSSRSTCSTSCLPSTFHEGLKRLQEQPSFRRYALFWQVFLWAFGGFYLADRWEEEFSCLSEQTGVPVSEINHALHAFDALFPLARGSWLMPLPGTPLVVVKMVPAPFRGIGALQRLRRYDACSYIEIGLSEYASKTLARWHNSTVALLGH